jgi:hypothetical protein
MGKPFGADYAVSGIINAGTSLEPRGKRSFRWRQSREKEETHQQWANFAKIGKAAKQVARLTGLRAGSCTGNQVTFGTLLNRYVAADQPRRSSEVPIEPKLDPNGPAPPLHMPGFKDMLTSDQLNDLVAYLLSLKPKGEESGF